MAQASNWFEGGIPRFRNGFGRADGASQGWSWTVEARSVNGRNLEVRFRGPPGFEGLERAASGFYGIPEAEYARSIGAENGRNPGPIPAFISTTPKISSNL